MGNYNSRRKDTLSGWQINVALMTFRGASDEEICVEQFKVDPDDKKALRNGKDRLRRLRRSERFQEYYKTLITDWTVHNLGKALTRLSQQLDSDKPWIVNKAANDILNQSKSFTGTDDNTVTIKIDSGIELGTPDGE